MALPLPSPPRGERGVTLVELMVAVVISGIVVGAVFTVLTNGTTLFSSQTAVAETQMTGRFAVAMIARDLSNAGNGTTPNCQTDPAFQLDRPASCEAFAGDGETAPTQIQAVVWKNFGGTYPGAAGADNSQFQPDELWIMTNPLPGQRLGVVGVNGNVVTLKASNDEQAAYGDAIVSYPLLLVEYHGERSIRETTGVEQPEGTDDEWLVTFESAPAGLVGFDGTGATVSAVVWIRYYLAPAVEGSDLVNLYREEWNAPVDPPGKRCPESGCPEIAMPIAEDIVDFQVSFCRDIDFDITKPPGVVNTVCGLGDEDTLDAQADSAALVNGNPEQLRTATITIRARSKAEDVGAYADPDNEVTWYDLNGNPDDGVARVRTMQRTVPLASLAR